MFFAKKTGDIYIMVHYNIAFKAVSLCLLIGLFTCAFSVSAQDNAKPLVVTSIKPLAIIVKSAFKDRVRVEYIMPAARSPHDVVIKLSDMRKLSAADLVFWIGPEFETRAAKQFLAVSEKKRVNAMALIDSEQTLTATDSHDHDHDHDHSHDVDPHVWLSPTLARQLVAELGVSCVFVEPQHGHKDAEAVAKDLSVPTRTIDILSVESETELPTYEAYIMGLARQFNACFL